MAGIISSSESGTDSNHPSSAKLALMLLDLNRFKEINDTLGHETGDKVLINVSDNLNRQVAADGGQLFRLGGDEFVAVYDAKSCTASFQNVAEELHTSLRKSIQVDDISMEMCTSIGIALYPENGLNSNELLRCADVAMYHAKKIDCHSSVYDAQNDLNNKRRLAMMVELGSAIRDNELTLYLQPQISIFSGELTGAEALLR